MPARNGWIAEVATQARLAWRDKFDEFGQRGAAAANAERPMVTTPKTPSVQVQSHCGSASILGLIGREFCPFVGDLSLGDVMCLLSVHRRPVVVVVGAAGADAVCDDEYFGDFVDGDDGAEAEDAEERGW